MPAILLLFFVAAFYTSTHCNTDCARNFSVCVGGDGAHGRRVEGGFQCGEKFCGEVVVLEENLAAVTPCELGVRNLVSARNALWQRHENGALPEGGELTIAYTIQNPVEGGNLTADPADDWMGEAKVSDEAVVFNVEPNEGEQARETTVTLTYVFGDDRNITAEVIVSQDFVQEEPDVPGEDPVIEIVTEEMTIPFAGGECRILYQVKDPVSDGKMSASSDAGWLTGFSCDDNNGVADFTAEANGTAETRSATVVLTYTYGGSKTVTAEFDLSQEASDPEAKYNYDYQLSYYFAEYYGNQFTDCHNWVFYLTDTPAEDGMYFPDNAVVYTIDLYAAADPENPENPLPAAGEYRISSDSEDMTFSDFMSYPTIPGYVAMIVDGTVNISYEGTDIIIEGIWTDENNATHHFVFNGPMEVTDMTEPEGPDDPDVPETPDEFNIEAFNYEAEYVNDVDGVMEVDLCFVDMPLDDMPIQTPIHQHAAFEIDKASGAEKSQVRAFERLLDCRYSIGLVRFADHGKADAIMRYTLIYLQLIDERTLHRDMDIPFVLCDSHYLSGFFNDT